MNGARVKLMELREYVSDRTGKTYFSGFLGKAKVVVLRDERAECTGREKARWSVLLEEQEARGADQPAGRNRRPTGPRKSAADRRAGQVMQEQGINPDGEMPRDDLPF